MPFDPAPIVKPEVKVGKYQDVADAMLSGCAKTRHVAGTWLDGQGGACAIGAWMVGAGFAEPDGFGLLGKGFDALAEIHEMRGAYLGRYGADITSDSDSGRYTREQIAARIAAL